MVESAEISDHFLLLRYKGGAPERSIRLESGSRAGGIRGVRARIFVRNDENLPAARRRKKTAAEGRAKLTENYVRLFHNCSAVNK